MHSRWFPSLACIRAQCPDHPAHGDEEWRERVVRTLQTFSPEVEFSSVWPDVYWVNLQGLESLYDSAQRWAQQCKTGLRVLGVEATLVLGFSKFGTFALSHSLPRGSIREYATYEEERTRAEAVLLRALPLPEEAIDSLLLLGVRTVKDWLELPSAGLLRRYGNEVHALHRFSEDYTWNTLHPTKIVLPIEASLCLDDPEEHVDSLLFRIKGLLPSLLQSLTSRCQALRSLLVRCCLYASAPIEFVISPAEPTLSETLLTDLIRLKLQTITLTSGVTEIYMHAEGIHATVAQLRLWAEHTKRDVRALQRALDRVRITYGEQSVVHADIQDRHLPEAQFQWKPLFRVPKPQVDPTLEPHMIRRIYTTPVPQPNSAYASMGVADSAAPAQPDQPYACGPYMVSGGWWLRRVERVYYFRHTLEDEFLWTYYEPGRRQWFLHGHIE
jgi:protein ImuB